MNQDNFSKTCQSQLKEVIDIIKETQIFISESQKANNFQRYLGQEIYWVLHRWLETIFQQNFTHISPSVEPSVQNLLQQMKGNFLHIRTEVKKLRFAFKSKYGEECDVIKSIQEGFQNLLKAGIEGFNSGIVKLETNTSLDEFQKYLTVLTFTEIQYKNIDSQFFKCQTELIKYGKNKEPYRTDCAYFIIDHGVTQCATLEADDVYVGLEKFCHQYLNKVLNKEKHLKKLEFYLDFDNTGQIQLSDVDDFFSFVWCNPYEREQFLSEKEYFKSDDKKNKYKLVLSLRKHSTSWDPCFPSLIYIDEYGVIPQDRRKSKEREKIRKPVRFGRKALNNNNLIPCDVYFGQREMTISKRQFVVKSDQDDYYAYCISTTNPTEFLVMTDGCFITKGSVITLSDKVCFIVTECIIPLDEEQVVEKIEEEGTVGDGPTVRRGKKNNPALAQIKSKADKMKEIQDPKDYKDKNIADEDDGLKIDNEITQKDEHKTFEKKKGGMKDIKEYFQKKMNNEKIDEEQAQYVTQEFKNQKKKQKDDDDDYRCFPNKDMTMKCTRKKGECYLQLELDWCDLECEDQIRETLEKFNKIQREKKPGYFNIGTAKGLEIPIDDSAIKEFQCYFVYREEFQKWICMDYNQNIMAAAIQKDQYTTVAFKGNNDKNHSELFKLQKGTVIVVSGNFLEVDYVDIDFDKNY
ncbi:hypothetical protein ABPG72_005969 [Tetrahymena utriculariae]